MVLQDIYCNKCGEEYTNIDCCWCKQCQIGNFKGNFTKWTSGNDEIDDFIHEMQLKIENPYNIVFEWIPYHQFSNIKEIGKSGFATVYLAIWNDGLLEYDKDKEGYSRQSDYEVA